MSETWPLLVLVSLKYCAEKGLLKTHVAFLIKNWKKKISDYFLEFQTPYLLINCSKS
jgi:hypothetical protein